MDDITRPHKTSRQNTPRHNRPRQLVVETDRHSRAVLAGHPNKRFLVYGNHDGSLLLVPTRAHPAEALPARAYPA